MFKNILWDLAGRFGAQIVSFFLSIILTRLLSPGEFGVMAMAMVLITFAHIFLDFGFYRAIIQKTEVSQEQYSTIFFLNAVLAFALTISCFFLASPLSKFYNEPLIKPVFRVLSVSFLLYGLNLVPSALLYKKLQFKVNSLFTLVSAVLSGIIGVVMAYSGWGVWSLVAQTLSSSFLLLAFNFAYTRWLPDLLFNISSLKPLWSYGSKMFASGILDTLYTRLDTFIIGKIFSTQTLGFYARAQSMDVMVRQFSANSIMGALFPYISLHQNDRPYLKELYKKYLHTILFISIGMSAVLFLVASDLFTVLFTERWLYSAEIFKLLSIAGFVWPISGLMCNIISGVGNSTAFLRLEFFKKILVLPVYIFGFLLGLKGFVICFVGACYATIFLNALYVKKEIEIRLAEQLKIISWYVCLGICSCLLCIFLLRFMPGFNIYLTIIITMSFFLLIYIIGAYAFKLRGTEVIDISIKKIKLALQ